jgi:hypothetical protein
LLVPQALEVDIRVVCTVILSRDRTSIQIRWYLQVPDISETLDGKKRYPTKGGFLDSSGGSPLPLPIHQKKVF